MLEPGGEISTSLDASTPRCPLAGTALLPQPRLPQTLLANFSFQRRKIHRSGKRAREQLEKWLSLLPKDRARAEQQLLDLGWEMPFWFGSLPPPIEQANVTITDVTYAQAGLDPKPSFVYSLIFKTKEQGDYYCTLAVPSDYYLP